MSTEEHDFSKLYFKAIKLGVNLASTAIYESIGKVLPCQASTKARPYRPSSLALVICHYSVEPIRTTYPIRVTRLKEKNPKPDEVK